MITNFKIYENKANKLNSAILFTDLKHSSKLWSESPDKMLKVLEEHKTRIDKILKNYDAFIIKGIGVFLYDLF